MYMYLKNDFVNILVKLATFHRKRTRGREKIFGEGLRVGWGRIGYDDRVNLLGGKAHV